MRRTEMHRSGVTLALCVGVLVVAFPQGSSACSSNRFASNQPPVSKILSSNNLVFVGVVTHSHVAVTRGHIGLLRFVTFRIEVPIKGTKGKTSVRIQYRDLGGRDPGFPVGQRWFVASDHDSANIGSGSVMLARPGEENGAHEKALHKAFPQILKLPPPERPAKPAP
jgi:hypothetical protein